MALLNELGLDGSWIAYRCGAWIHAHMHALLGAGAAGGGAGSSNAATATARQMAHHSWLGTAMAAAAAACDELRHHADARGEGFWAHW